MSEFRKVERAKFSPTSCTFCGAHEGPFIDTQVDIVAHGHIYICATSEHRSGCVRQLARLDNLADPEEVMQITSDLVEAQARVVELEGLLGKKKASVEDILLALGAKNE